MPSSFRILEHWNQWLAKQFLGATLLDAEYHTLNPLLANHFGKHALLIGVPAQYPLLTAATLPCRTLISPLIHHEKKNCSVEANFHELPIHTGSIDAVFLPHTLEFVDNPRQLLAEACRIIRPEGFIIICGFNPTSLWGIRKYFGKQAHIPWNAPFIPSYRIKKWLHLADFVLETQTSCLFRPPISKKTIYQKLVFFDYIGKLLPGLGSIYVLLARAKVIPMTPIRLKWRQPLSRVGISTGMSGFV